MPIVYTRKGGDIISAMSSEGERVQRRIWVEPRKGILVSKVVDRIEDGNGNVLWPNSDTSLKKRTLQVAPGVTVELTSNEEYESTASCIGPIFPRT